MIAIVDYGAGNIKAILNIYKLLNINVSIIKNSRQLEEANKIILAGVGAFDDSMSRLNNSGMREILDRQVLEKHVPVLGICVGMQMMACGSEEGKESGLCWFENSRVIKIDELNLQHKPKLPHMGWNKVQPLKNHSIFNNINKNKGFYFLHSYHFFCHQKYHLGITNYGSEFASAVCKDNIYGLQFHPEKSHSNGINVLKNFSEC
ncbi:MAG: imidazole glycerol phosphate synthase subunit HisH [Verrucomicrobia bacterium TMED56]|nr:MAG: imidazole glycerol phosphate synthase subunit HisH [Verrucomicrobia bacterium TMED56]|tara:strand:+ start:507 stop:1121 length:615 start_codon:yes stop_codon:yes gene_type:complete